MRRIKSIIAVFLVGLIMFTNFPETLNLYAGSETIAENSSVCLQNTDECCGHEHEHEAAGVCTGCECSEHEHEAAGICTGCECSEHEHEAAGVCTGCECCEHDHDHEVACDCCSDTHSDTSNDDALQQYTSYSTQDSAVNFEEKIKTFHNLTFKDLTGQITDRITENTIEANNMTYGISPAACAHVFNGSYTTVKEPTCTTAGKKEGRCTKCGEVVSTVSIAALGHSYGSWTTTKAATCTADGSRKRTCSRCSVSETQTISATGHTFNGSYTTIKEPT